MIAGGRLLALVVTWGCLATGGSFSAVRPGADVTNRRMARGPGQLPPEWDHVGQTLPWYSRLTRAPHRALYLSAGSESPVNEAAQPSTVPAEPSTVSKALEFLNKNFFLLGAGVAIAAAKVFPHIGRTGGLLRPEITISKLGVFVIFYVVGLSIKLGNLASAAGNWRLNGLIQGFNLAVLPSVGYGLSTLLGRAGLAQALTNGLLVLMCLPTTINMCVILTQGAEGDVAVAAFNAVLGNTLGVFVTPALIFLFFGASLKLDLGRTLGKLASLVILPAALGMLSQKTRLKQVMADHRKRFTRLSECILLAIIFTTFSDLFLNKGVTAAAGSGVAALFGIIPLLYVSLAAVLYALTGLPVFKLGPEERTAALFCGSPKTLAFGIPLIKTLFAGSPDVGLIALPLLVYHPTELLLGGLLIPFLRRSQKQWHVQNDHPAVRVDEFVPPRNADMV